MNIYGTRVAIVNYCTPVNNELITYLDHVGFNVTSIAANSDFIFSLKNRDEDIDLALLCIANYDSVISEIVGFLDLVNRIPVIILC